eukprot:SAG31_NODE_2869_length_4976_cov_1.541111_4_plen_195_part_00
MDNEYQQVLQQCEDDLEIAVDAIAQGRRLQAIESLSYVVDNWPRNVFTSQRARRCIVEALCLRADIAADSNEDYDSAMEDLNAALTIQPDSSAAHVRCAQYLARKTSKTLPTRPAGTDHKQNDQDQNEQQTVKDERSVSDIEAAQMHCIAALVVGCEVEELLSLASLLEELSKKIGRSRGESGQFLFAATARIG